MYAGRQVAQVFVSRCSVFRESPAGIAIKSKVRKVCLKPIHPNSGRFFALFSELLHYVSRTIRPQFMNTEPSWKFRFPAGVSRRRFPGKTPISQNFSDPPLRTYLLLVAPRICHRLRYYPHISADCIVNPLFTDISALSTQVYNNSLFTLVIMIMFLLNLRIVLADNINDTCNQIQEIIAPQ